MIRANDLVSIAGRTSSKAALIVLPFDPGTVTVLELISDERTFLGESYRRCQQHLLKHHGTPNPRLHLSDGEGGSQSLTGSAVGRQNSFDAPGLQRFPRCARRVAVIYPFPPHLGVPTLFPSFCFSFSGVECLQHRQSRAY